MRLTALVLLLSFLPMNAGQAALGRISFPALVCQAELIVQGRVESFLSATQSHQLGRDKGQEAEFIASSVASLSIENVLKGPSDIRGVQVEFSSVEDSPRYKLGETVVVFLTWSPRRDVYTTVGMLQGRFAIVGGMVERERIPVAEFVRRIRTMKCAAPQAGR